jgi:hypothetical protein
MTKAKRDQAWVKICEEIQSTVNTPGEPRERPQSYAGPYPAFLEDKPTRISVRVPYSPAISEDRLSELIQLARTDPRAAIRESWSELGGAILGAANVTSGNVDPLSTDISLSLKRLELDTRIPHGRIRSIPDLQEKARKVFYQSPYAYDPSLNEAQEFVRAAALVNNELARLF